MFLYRALNGIRIFTTALFLDPWLVSYSFATLKAFGITSADILALYPHLLSVPKQRGGKCQI